MISPAPAATPLSASEKRYRLALNHGLLSARHFWKLLAVTGSARNIFELSLTELKNHLSVKTAEKLHQYCLTCDPDEIWENLPTEIRLAFFESPDYPDLLRQIYDPPYVLHWRGKRLWHGRTLGMVGTRRPTPYGIQHTQIIARYLTQQQCTVISGMALGIDAVAHKETLAAGGMTLAVLGSGLKQPAPRTHLKLFAQLCEQGMVVSEFPPDFKAKPWTFPLRNRLVSGMSAGLVVTEAARKSGTLITVDCAIEQGREVFALPGPVHSPQSEGTHILIQQGAHLLARPEDISATLGWQNVPAPEASPLTNTPSGVYEVLSAHPQSVEALATQSGKNMAEVLSILTELEINGLVEGLPGKLYRKS